MEGKLAIMAIVNSPFAKYIHAKTEVATSQLRKIQNNDMLQRGITLKASYRISWEKRANVDRDISLRNEDLSTSVQ